MTGLQAAVSRQKGGGWPAGAGFKCLHARRLSREPTVGGRLMPPIYEDVRSWHCSGDQCELEFALGEA